MNFYYLVPGVLLLFAFLIFLVKPIADESRREFLFMVAQVLGLFILASFFCFLIYIGLGGSTKSKTCSFDDYDAVSFKVRTKDGVKVENGFIIYDENVVVHDGPFMVEVVTGLVDGGNRFKFRINCSLLTLSEEVEESTK